MIVGALIDLGLAPQTILDAIESIALNGEIKISVRKVKKKDFVASFFEVLSSAPSVVRSYDSIASLVESGSLTPNVKQKFLQMLNQLARAEAKVHGLAVDEVEFHELGAWDTIADLLAIAVGLDFFQVEHVEIKALEVGSGARDTHSHGVVPIPAPATLELLSGFSFSSTVPGYELCTPTGAAFLAAFAIKNVTATPITFLRTGYGAGSLDLGDRANVLVVGLASHESSSEDYTKQIEEVVKLETNVDDCSPEYVSEVVSMLLDHGALDAWTTPIVAKKGRSGVVVTALCKQPNVYGLADILHKNLGTLGVRMTTLSRQILDRQIVSVQVDEHTINVKVNPYTSKVEFGDLVKLARAKGLSIPEAYRLCRDAFSADFPDLHSPS